MAAQAPGRFTLGGQFVALFSNQVQASPLGPGVLGGSCRCGFYGGGLVFTVRLVKRLSLSASLNYLPHRGAPFFNWGYRLFAIGPRLRLNPGRRWAIYLGFRPTWGSQNGTSQQTLQTPSGSATSTYSYTNTFWGFETDATLQARITRHWLWRLTVGDVWVIGPRCGNCVSDGDASSVPAQNPQISTGFAVRF